MEGQNMDRRSFLKLNIQSLFTTAKELIKDRLEVERTYIRPPGAVDESSFLMMCQRCGECEKACPEGIILTLGAHAGKGVGTPILNLYKDACTFCMKCVEACEPYGALEMIPVEQMKIGYAKINTDLCVAWQGSQPCDYCREFCTLEQKAIEIKEGRPYVNVDLCNGCGDCKHICVNSKDTIQIIPA